jgi:hypothetical protein
MLVDANTMDDDFWVVPKPWQIRIGYSKTLSKLVIEDILHHTNPSVVFSDEAVDFCGGIVESDKDDYVIAVVNDEYAIISTARLIAKMSSIEASSNL